MSFLNTSPNCNFSIPIFRNVFEYLPDNDFVSLFHSSRDIRTISLAILLERYISCGICHFEQGLRFSSNSIQDLRAAFASITELNCSVSLQDLFLRSADTKRKSRRPRRYLALGSVIACLSLLSEVSVTIVRDLSIPNSRRHRVRYPVTQLIRGFLSSHSSKQGPSLLVLESGVVPFISKPRRNIRPLFWPSICPVCLPTIPLRFIAHVQRLFYVVDNFIRRVPYYIADPLGRGNSVARIQQDNESLDSRCNSFRITNIASFPRWSLLIAGVATFTSLKLDANIASLKWDTILPLLHLPILRTVTVSPGCRVSKAALCAFLSRHPLVTSLFLRSFHITELMPSFNRGGQRTRWPMPTITVFGAQLTVMERMLPHIDLQKVTTVIIGDDEFVQRSRPFWVLPLRRKFPFHALGRVLDVLATCNTASLTLSLPGGLLSKDWLTARVNEASGVDRKWTALQTLEVYPVPDEPFAPDVRELLEQWAGLFPSLQQWVIHPTYEDERHADLSPALWEVKEEKVV